MLSEATRTLMIEMARAARGAADTKLELDPYPSLVTNVFDATLRRAFPIAYAVLSEPGTAAQQSGAWSALVRDVVVSGRSDEPHLWKMPRVLLESAEIDSWAKKLEMPWLCDLFRFEWSEIAVHMMPHLPIAGVGGSGTALLAINRDNTIIHLKYPVFRTKERSVWGDKGDFFVCCFRVLGSGSVRYMELAPWAVVLIEEWGANLWTHDQLLVESRALLGSDFPSTEAEVFIDLLVSEGLAVSLES